MTIIIKTYVNSFLSWSFDLKWQPKMVSIQTYHTLSQQQITT